MTNTGYVLNKESRDKIGELARKHGFQIWNNPGGVCLFREGYPYLQLGASNDDEDLETVVEYMRLHFGEDDNDQA